MTIEQIRLMESQRTQWVQHEREKRKIYGTFASLVDLLWGFEVGWSMAQGIPIREIPAWLEQPGLSQAEIE